MINIRINQRLRYYFSMLFSLLLVYKSSVFLFYIRIVFRNILTIALLIKNTTLVLALAMATGVAVAVVNEH